MPKQLRSIAAARFCNFQYHANNDHFGRTLSVGRVVILSSAPQRQSLIRALLLTPAPPPSPHLPSLRPSRAHHVQPWP